MHQSLAGERSPVESRIGQEHNTEPFTFVPCWQKELFSFTFKFQEVEIAGTEGDERLRTAHEVLDTPRASIEES